MIQLQNDKQDTELNFSVYACNLHFYLFEHIWSVPKNVLSQLVLYIFIYFCFILPLSDIISHIHWMDFYMKIYYIYVGIIKKLVAI